MKYPFSNCSLCSHPPPAERLQVCMQLMQEGVLEKDASAIISFHNILEPQMVRNDHNFLDCPSKYFSLHWLKTLILNMLTQLSNLNKLPQQIETTVLCDWHCPRTSPCDPGGLVLIQTNLTDLTNNVDKWKM